MERLGLLTRHQGIKATPRRSNCGGEAGCDFRKTAAAGQAASGLSWVRGTPSDSGIVDRLTVRRSDGIVTTPRPSLANPSRHHGRVTARWAVSLLPQGARRLSLRRG